MKKALFHPKARESIRSFPDEVRYKIGKAILFLQRGHMLSMPDSRPFPSIGKGASEIRVRGKDCIYRTFYLINSTKGILVFHAFMKKTSKTPHLEIELARKRLKEIS